MWWLKWIVVLDMLRHEILEKGCVTVTSFSIQDRQEVSGLILIDVALAQSSLSMDNSTGQSWW